MKTLTFLSLLIVWNMVLKAQKITTNTPAGDEKQLESVNYSKQQITVITHDQIAFDPILAWFHPAFQLKIKSLYRFRAFYNWANPAISTNDIRVKSDPGTLAGHLPFSTSFYFKLLYATHDGPLKMVTPSMANLTTSAIAGFTNCLDNNVQRADSGLISNIQLFPSRNFKPGICYNIGLHNPGLTNRNYTSYVLEKSPKLFSNLYHQ